MVSMFAIMTLFSAVLAIVTVAQAYPPPAPAPATAPIESGGCLDSARSVPLVLRPPVSRAMQIVRIDQIVSTATDMPGEILGFLYTTADGTTWLGERTAHYTSPAAAEAMNQLLASTHLPDENVTEFPPQTRYGVATKYPQFFRVRIPPAADAPLRVQLLPCVAWPATRPLPDPSM
jgi:hypothetical protein